MPRRRKLRIVERKLGRDLALGQYWNGERLIEIDPRLRAKSYLRTLLHELIHDSFPKASESKVEQASGDMANAIWRQGFRRISK